MKNFHYEPLFLTPSKEKELGRGSVSLGLAPLDEVIDVIRYTVSAQQIYGSTERLFQHFLVWHGDASEASLYDDCWNRDFLMLDAEGSLNAVYNYELDDEAAPTDLKKKLGNAVYRWCIDEHSVKPVVKISKEGKLFARMPEGSFPISTLKIDIETAKMVHKILLGKRPKGCEKYMPKPAVPWLRDTLLKLENKISEEQKKIREDFLEKIHELERQAQMLREECTKMANDLSDAEAAKLKEVFKDADEQLGVKGCEMIGRLHKVQYF